MHLKSKLLEIKNIFFIYKFVYRLNIMITLFSCDLFQVFYFLNVISNAG